jgi:hypothetical protein
MSFFERCESRLGHWGIPGLIQGLGVFHVLTFLLVKFKPEFLDTLTLLLPKIKEGEVWRALSYLMLPPTQSPLWIIFSVMFMMFTGRLIESFWSPFRVTCYVVLSAVVVSAAVLLIQWQLIKNGQIAAWDSLTINNLGLIHSMVAVQAFGLSLLLAMATLAPRQEIMVMFVFPVQLRWGGLATAVISLFLALRSPFYWPLLAGFVPWLLFFGRETFMSWRSQATQAQRRRSFSAEAKVDAGQAFHTCAQCAKNDLTHPQLEFRLLDDDTELCEECLKKNRASSITPSSL